MAVVAIFASTPASRKQVRACALCGACATAICVGMHWSTDLRCRPCFMPSHHLAPSAPIPVGMQVETKWAEFKKYILSSKFKTLFYTSPSTAVTKTVKSTVPASTTGTM